MKGLMAESEWNPIKKIQGWLLFVSFRVVVRLSAVSWKIVAMTMISC